MPSPLITVPLGRWVDPASVYALLDAENDHVFWLDAGPDAATGWSWVGAGSLEDHPERVRDVVCAGDEGSATDRNSWQAGRFRGGWVGWWGYEPAAAFAGAPISGTAAQAPNARWLRSSCFVAFDHDAHEAWAVGAIDEVGDFATRVWAGAHDAILATTPSPAPVTARHSPAEYAGLIASCREAIRNGDAYQLCLTTRFSTTASIDPSAAFARLRRATPAHHGGIVKSGEYALASASPEQFLEVDAGIVRTRPIKGTRPRGADPAQDAQNARELQASVKERAENVMIVDLMRNDLSRVCLPGSVGVDALLDVESYPAVHQLVSTVSGRLSTGTTVGNLLDATFPAGSMTGAPKLSAMTILHSLELEARGVFAGCYGWIGDDGALDLAMVIRSIVTFPGGAYVGAGGGITWRSDAADEVAEVGIKARGPLAAIGATLPPGW